MVRLETAKRRSSTPSRAPPPDPTRDEDPPAASPSNSSPTRPKAAAGADGALRGVITINIAEADDAERETAADGMHEPYRTLLGHFRHESGHYYWDRLIGRLRLDEFRTVFGDERPDTRRRSRRTTGTERLPTGRTLRQRLRQRASLGRLGRDLGALPAHHRHARDGGALRPLAAAAPRRRADAARSRRRTPRRGAGRSIS